MRSGLRLSGKVRLGLIVALAGLGPLQAADLEMTMGELPQWRLQGTAAESASFEASAAPTPDNGPAIEIAYAQSRHSDPFIELVRGKVVYMPDDLKSVSFWVKGNGRGDSLAIRLIDDDRATHQWTSPEKITWNGWRKVTVTLAPDDPNHLSWKSGESPERGRAPSYPLFFRSVVLRIHAEVDEPGKVAIGDLQFDPGLN